ncbi:MAG: twin-arginine translocase subunit TatC [Planctomycetota bacterium]|jgi:sec-independent protein translocase protein TatC
MGETNKKDDLFDSTMSLGDHLEELRMRMIRALLGLSIGGVVCLVFGRTIIKFMEGPYDDATSKLLFNIDLEFQVDLDKGIVTKGLRQEFRDNGVVLSPDVKVKQKGYLFSGRRWLVDDGVDNRYCVKKEDAKVKKEEDTLNIYRLKPLQVIAVAAGFISYLKIALIAGLLLSSPWVFYQLWMFVAAGLYPHEKRYVNIAAPFSAVLFVAGALFFLIVVAPLTLKFLVSFNRRILDVNSQFTFQHYIAFVSHLMLVFGLAFQTPTAIFFLNRTGLVSIEALNKSRKFVILVIFVVAAMATPPDVISQVTLAIPLYLLFELGILLSYLAERRRRAQNNQ